MKLSICDIKKLRKSHGQKRVLKMFFNIALFDFARGFFCLRIRIMDIRDIRKEVISEVLQFECCKCHMTTVDILPGGSDNIVTIKARSKYCTHCGYLMKYDILWGNDPATAHKESVYYPGNVRCGEDLEELNKEPKLHDLFHIIDEGVTNLEVTKSFEISKLKGFNYLFSIRIEIFDGKNRGTWGSFHQKVRPGQRKEVDKKKT